MSGSRVRIWKQDPSVEAIGVRTSFIHTKVDAGPRDAEIIIDGDGIDIVEPDTDGDFLLSPDDAGSDFDAVHTYAVVRHVVTMYKRALLRLTGSAEFAWQWGAGTPIKVYPRAGEDKNAYYSRDQRALRFFHFYWPEQDKIVYTNRSFDIVAHETGHALLDALKPGYFESNREPQTGGLHESFGDLTAIFTMLSQLDQCEAIIAESKADLDAKSYISVVAEQFGEALYGHDLGLRNANNDLKLSEVTTEVHDLSQVFTGAVFDILIAMFEAHRRDEAYDPAETLFRVGKHLTSLVIFAFLAGPDRDATYADIAEQMEQAEPIEEWKPMIREAFERREVFHGRPRRLKAAEVSAAACPTMRLAEKAGAQKAEG